MVVGVVGIIYSIVKFIKLIWEFETATPFQPHLQTQI